MGSPRPPTLSVSDHMHTELFSANNGRASKNCVSIYASVGCFVSSGM